MIDTPIDTASLIQDNLGPYHAISPSGQHRVDDDHEKGLDISEFQEDTPLSPRDQLDAFLDSTAPSPEPLRGSLGVPTEIILDDLSTLSAPTSPGPPIYHDNSPLSASFTFDCPETHHSATSDTNGLNNEDPAERVRVSKDGVREEDMSEFKQAEEMLKELMDTTKKST